MKDKVFLHTKENISIIVKKYLLCLLPLIIYGIYKNGYLLYSRNLISFPEIFKIVYLLLISFCVYLIINKLIFKKSFWSLDLVFILVIPLFMPSNINIVIYTLGLFMSYSNIRAHFNGNITVETTPGKGTAFHIQIPMTA